MELHNLYRSPVLTGSGDCKYVKGVCGLEKGEKNLRGVIALSLHWPFYDDKVGEHGC
jgi:hypothetical protein